MILPYLRTTASRPIPSLGGDFSRYRPVWHVRISGPAGSVLVDGLFDTGTDDTVLEEWVAATVGIDLGGAPQLPHLGVGASQPFFCRYAPVNLLLTDYRAETYTWNATVGFTTASLPYMVFGHAGFLQYFDVEFRGYLREVVLDGNPSFPGRRM